MTWGQRLIRIAEQALEELARQEFSAQRILDIAREAAALGYAQVSIEPSRPVDLRRTAAYRETASELEKQRLQLDWKTRPDRSGLQIYPVLLVSWEHADKEGRPVVYRR